MEFPQAAPANAANPAARAANPTALVAHLPNYPFGLNFPNHASGTFVVARSTAHASDGGVAAHGTAHASDAGRAPASALSSPTQVPAAHDKEEMLNLRLKILQLEAKLSAQQPNQG